MKPNQSVREKVAKGLVPETFKVVFKFALSLAKIAILARLVTPADFGLIGIAMAMVTGLETLTQVGAEKYLIQKSSVDDHFIDAVWFFNIMRGLLVCLITLSLAPLYAGVMQQPGVTGVLEIVAFSSLLRGLKSPGTILAERELQYASVVAYELTGALFDLLLMVGCCLGIGGSRGLAWGMFLVALVEVALSYIFFRVSRKPRWHKAAILDICSVGKHLVVISVFSYIMVQGDNLIVGALLGTTLLGFYLVAYKLVDVPLNFVYQITNRVLFSGLSRLQDNPPKMRRAFLELFEVQMAVLLPIIGGIVMLADCIVILMYGNKWALSIPVVRALALILIGRGFTLAIVPYIMARGDFVFISRVKVFETLTFVVAVAMGTIKGGIVGAALGGGVGYLSAAGIRVWYLYRYSGIELSEIGRRVGLFSGITVFALLLAYPVKNLVQGSWWMEFLGTGLCYALVYCVLVFLFNRPLITKLVASLKLILAAKESRPKVAV